MQSIAIPRTLANRILAQAQRHAEEEVCGLISARGGEPSRLYPVANVAERPERLFRLDPQGQIDAMRTMREGGEALFAIYHSHPHAPAAPSATDLAESAYPEALHLIVSLDTEGVLEMAGFYLRGEGVERVELVCR